MPPLPGIAAAPGGDAQPDRRKARRRSISSRDLASLTKRLADMSAEIEAIDKASNGHDPAMQALDTEDIRLDEHED